MAKSTLSPLSTLEATHSTKRLDAGNAKIMPIPGLKSPERG